MPEISASFAKWIPNLLVENKTIISELHDDAIHFPSLITFLTANACLSDLTSQECCALHRKVIKQIANGRNYSNHCILMSCN